MVVMMSSALPPLVRNDLVRGLVKLWPKLLPYVLSFGVLGLRVSALLAIALSFVSTKIALLALALNFAQPMIEKWRRRGAGGAVSG
jgi:hypothetical protein